jgi:hypothetical protein
MDRFSRMALNVQAHGASWVAALLALAFALSVALSSATF